MACQSKNNSCRVSKITHGSCLCYTGCAALSPIWQQGEVKRMPAILVDFLVAVAAQVTAYYLCKWLNNHHKGK